MQRRDHAIELFRQRFNCSQAVFTAYRQSEILDEENALKLSTVFGAGVASTGKELCGALSGALMAISMHHGRGDLQAIDAKTKTYELGRQFMAEFESRIGSCTCEAILGLNIGSAQNLAKAQEMKLFETRCVDVVKTASDILEGIL